MGAVSHGRELIDKALALNVRLPAVGPGMDPESPVHISLAQPARGWCCT